MDLQFTNTSGTFHNFHINYIRLTAVTKQLPECSDECKIVYT